MNKTGLRKEWKNMIFNTIFGILTLAIPCLFFKDIATTTFLIAIVAVIGLIKWKSPLTMGIFVFSSIFGSFAEMIAINYGVWSYSLTHLLNIPYWLFFVWGNAGAFTYQTAIEFERLGLHK